MRDGTATRKKLERCALNLFVKKGVIATTIKDIASAADVAEGTMYRHYQSKEDLATELYIRAYKDLFHALKDSIARFQGLKERLLAICDLVCHAYDDDPITFNYLLLAQHHQLPKINQENYSLNSFLCALFDEAMEKGEIAKDDSNFYSGVILGVLIQAAAQRTYHRIDRPLGEDHKKLAETLFKALEI